VPPICFNFPISRTNQTGGLRVALTRSSVGGNATIVRAFDWDQIACAVYTANHGPGIAHRVRVHHGLFFSSPKFHCLLTDHCSHVQVDINTLDADALEPLNADLWLLSPACQPYTVLNPNSKGASDPRAQSFLYLIEGVLPALAERGAAPTRLLVENVAGFEVRGHVLSQAFSQ
jgi:tRNA (cytosine38-C5)-methyltransferase